MFPSAWKNYYNCTSGDKKNCRYICYQQPQALLLICLSRAWCLNLRGAANWISACSHAICLTFAVCSPSLILGSKITSDMLLILTLVICSLLFADYLQIQFYLGLKNTILTLSQPVHDVCVLIASRTVFPFLINVRPQYTCIAWHIFRLNYD